MKRALVFLVLGTALAFLFNRTFSSFGSVEVDLYYAFAFGLAWAMAYLLDTPKIALAKKLLYSLAGIAFLILVGLVFFTFEIAIPSVIRFSIIFVLYNLLASFRSSKSLRR